MRSHVTLPILLGVLAISPLASHADPFPAEGEGEPTATHAPAAPPVVLGAQPQNEANPLTLPDGSLFAMFREERGSPTFYAVQSTDGGATWSEPRPVATVEGANGYGCRTLVDDRGEVHVFFLRGEGLRIHHFHSEQGRMLWTEPKLIFDGRVGSLRSAIQLAGGRILLPHQHRTPDRDRTHPTGWGVTTVDYSDDHGETWRNTGTALTAPCSPDYNGSNVGATEPAIIELADGRVWMLMRTQAGYHYESFSTDQGLTWSDAVPSRFPSHNGTPALVRAADGRIVLIWNNAGPVSKHDGRGVYGGRDAIHAAISADEGRTWRGFREIYRDPLRHHVGEPKHDRGTAYPNATPLPDGDIIIFTGQQEGRRAILRLDPDWLEQTQQSADFAGGIDDWMTFKNIGPHLGAVFRERVQAAQWVDHPDEPGRKAMRLARRDEHDGDGAAWNFPAGVAGSLTLRVRLEPGFGGAHLGLSDRLFEPCDPTTDARLAFGVSIAPSGALGEGGATLRSGQWHEINLAWSDGRCRVTLDGRPAGELSPRVTATNGLSYLYLRSTAPTIDAAGFLVDRVSVSVAP